MSIATNNPRYNANKRLSGGKRTAEQREADKRFSAQLFVKGYTYRQIAEKLNEHNSENGLNYTLTYKSIFMDIQQVLIDWKKERFKNIDDYMQLELKKLDKIEVELWEAWERSKGSKRRTKIKGGSISSGAASGGELAERTLETTDGDPRYLDLLLKVQERRAKLLGYNAPVKVDICSSLPKKESPAEVKYDINALPVDILVNMAYKLQDAEFERRKKEGTSGQIEATINKEISNGKEESIITEQ